MSAPPPIIEAEDAILGRLAALDIQAAEHVHGCLLDTTTPAEVAELSRAYARASRCVRQTLALHARLKGDREKAAREAERHVVQMARAAIAPSAAHPDFDPDPDFAPDPDEIYFARKVEDLRGAVDRVVSHVADGDLTRHTRLIHRFERELDDWLETPDFLDTPLDELVAEACKTLELPGTLARTWQDLPPATFFPEPEELAAFDTDDDRPDAEAQRPGQTEAASLSADPDADPPDDPPDDPALRRGSG